MIFCWKRYFVLIFRSQINLCLQMVQFFCRISYFYFILPKKFDKIVFKYLDIFVRFLSSRIRKHYRIYYRIFIIEFSNVLSKEVIELFASNELFASKATKMTSL